jgi:hypothetical protein
MPLSPAFWFGTAPTPTAREETVTDKVIVFEAINESLQELYVGISTLPLAMDEIAIRNNEQPPKAIGHWRQGDNIWYHCIEPSLPTKDTQNFIRTYAKKIARAHWKVLAEI